MLTTSITDMAEYLYIAVSAFILVAQQCWQTFTSISNIKYKKDKI